MKLKSPQVDRRTLLIGGGAGLGLIVAWGLWPREYGSGLVPRAGEQVFGHYLKIGEDWRVTVAVPQVETGQGVWTALPQIVADELGAAWETIAVEPAPSARAYANPLATEQGWLAGLSGWRASRIVDQGLSRITAGSTSVRAFEQPLREAGAMARALLSAAAAARWNVAAAECDTESGFVVHEGKRLPFGAVAAEAAELTPPERSPLRQAGRGRLMGEALPRLDLPPKTDGSFRFAGDVRLPGLVYAAARLSPAEGGGVTGFDRRRARGPGVTDVIATDRWVAAVAQTGWAAERALARAAVKTTGPADADTAAIDAALGTAMSTGNARTLFERGDFAAAIEGARPLSATYRAAPALHLDLEPLIATARITGDRLEVWAATQAPELARMTAADAAGLQLDRVTLYPMPVGGQGGRALEADAIPIAVELARRTGRPVQLVLSRAQSVHHDKPRAPVLARMSARPTPEGRLSAWGMKIAGADGTAETMARLFGGTGAWRPHAAEALVPPYAIPAVRVDVVDAELPIQTGYLRGESAGFGAFFTECFVDELARIAGAEPLAFRIGLLTGNVRLAQALTTAAAIGGWDGGGQGSSMGIACLSAFGSHIGLVASASVTPDQRIRVDRMVAAVDCGRVVNPNLVRQQIEGGLIAGLAQATQPLPKFRYGMAVAGPPRGPRLAGTPRIEVELIRSNAEPGGVNGLGFAAVAPAIANALYAATGRRLRRLPLDPMSGE